MFMQNPRALTSSNRFDAAARNANYVNASFFNNLLCPVCRNLIRHFHFVQKLTLFYRSRAHLSATSLHRSVPPIESEGLQHTLENSSLPVLIGKIRHES